MYTLTMHHLLKKAEDCQRDAPSVRQVSPRVPILYFGDFEGFKMSACRIVTVALNPSLAEFPEASPFQRFPSLRSYSKCYHDNFRLQKAYNEYFKINPYRKWFGNFEMVLNGFDASFFDSCGYKNTALHTDLLSPVATNPTWSKLNKTDKDTISKRGVDLWHSLIRFLDPDILIISVAKRYLDQIRFPKLEKTVELFSVPDKVRKRVTTYPVSLSGKKHANLIYATPAQVPFGYLSHDEKRGIGACFSQLHQFP